MKYSKIKQDIPMAQPVLIEPPKVYNYCRECGQLFLANPKHKFTNLF